MASKAAKSSEAVDEALQYLSSLMFRVLLLSGGKQPSIHIKR